MRMWSNGNMTGQTVIKFSTHCTSSYSDKTVVYKTAWIHTVLDAPDISFYFSC